MNHVKTLSLTGKFFYATLALMITLTSFPVAEKIIKKDKNPPELSIINSDQLAVKPVEQADAVGTSSEALDLEKIALIRQERERTKMKMNALKNRSKHQQIGKMKKKGQSQSFQKSSIPGRTPSVSNPFHLKKKLSHEGGFPNVMGWQGSRSTTDVNFTTHVITTSADGAWSVYATDVDGDGDVDVLSASVNDDKIAWYENDGNESFTAHAITTSADAAYSVYATDVDGDGDVDVLSASYWDDTIAWYENDGNENFTAHAITTSADGAISVYATDLDGDGDVDVLSASESDDKIAWYENDGSESFTVHNITTSADGAWSVYATDVDGDGDVDVLSASQYDDTIAWYENDGNESFTADTITTSAVGARSVYTTDVDGDVDVDVLSASQYDDTIAWYENDGNESFTAHTITTSADGAYSVYATDVDGDGYVDVLSASMNDDKIAWYENDGSESFTAHTITTSADGAISVYATDLDGDGDVDVLSASYYDDTIAWYENGVIGIIDVQVNGADADTITQGDDIVFTVYFSTGYAEADLTFWLDMDGNGILDTLVDFDIEEGEYIEDGDFEDETPPGDGVYQFTIYGDEDGPNRVSNLGFLLYVEDAGGADVAYLYIEPMVADYSVSGTVTPALANILVGAFPSRHDDGDRPDDEEDMPWMTVTDAAGLYQNFVPDTGEYHIFSFDFLDVTDGMFPDTFYTDVLVNGHLTDYDFNYIAPSAWIEGIVIDEYSDPIEGIEVWADTDYGLETWTETDEFGHYSLGVIEGDWWVGVDEEDLIPDYLVPHGETRYVDEGATEIVNFTVYSTDATIEGTIFLDDFPIGDIGVNAHSPLGWTDTRSGTDGHYVLDVASEADAQGGYDLWLFDLPPEVYVEEYYGGIPSGSIVIDFHLYSIPVGAIEGVITDETTGDSLANVQIRFWDFYTGDRYTTWTDEHGLYYQDLPVGEYRVRARGDYLGYINEYYDNKFHYSEADPVSVLDDQITEINIQLGVGGAISGTLTDPDGNPIPGVNNVIVRDWNEVDGWHDFRGAALSDGNGNYTVTGIPTGDQLVIARTGGFFTEYYDGTYDPESATPVYVTAPNTTSGINFVLELDGSLYAQTAGNMWLSIGNDTRLGSEGGGYFPSAEWPGGSGNSYLYSGGLWVGTETEDFRSVSAAYYGSEWVSSTEFSVEEVYSDEDVNIGFNDMNPDVNPNPLGLEVSQASYAWEGEDYIILRYRIRNTGMMGELNNVMVGLFFDFDIATAAGNNYWADDMVGFESDIGISYMHDDEGDAGASPGFIGIHPLNQPIHSHSWWPGYMDPKDDWTKYDYLTSGVMEDPNYPMELRILQSIGPFFLAPGSGMEIFFALAIGDGLDGLVAATENAQAKFDEVFAVPYAPELTSVLDVPNDQGRQVRLISSSGSPGLGNRFIEYSIWRLVEGEENDLWDFITTVPYIGLGDYAYVAPTLVDSNMYTGPEDSFWSTFRVIAHTQKSDFFLVSESMSGYSIDNLEPSEPGGLLASASTAEIVLQWLPNPEEDLDYYTIYRGTNSGFEPGEPFAHTIDTVFVDSGVESDITYFYVVTATDFNGNESGYSEEVGSSLGIDEIGQIPTEYALYSNFPNPFNPSTTIQFDLPNDGTVLLSIYNLLGQEINTVVNREFQAGRYRFEWDGTNKTGKLVPSGVYFYRISVDGNEYIETRKMMLLR